MQQIVETYREYFEDGLNAVSLAQFETILSLVLQENGQDFRSVSPVLVVLWRLYSFQQPIKNFRFRNKLS